MMSNGSNVDVSDLYLEDVSNAFDMLDDADLYRQDSGADEDNDVYGYGDYEDAEELFEADDIEGFEKNFEDEQKSEEEIDNGFFEQIGEDTELVIADQKLTKKQLELLVKQSKDVSESVNGLANLSTHLEDQEISLKKHLSSNMLECDIKIEEIERRLADPMLNNSQKGALVPQLNFYRHRKQEIETQSKNYEQSLYNSKMEVVKQRYAIANREISKEVADWGEMGKKVHEYALNAGIKDVELHQAVSPALIRVLMKAMKHDETIGRTNETLKNKLKPNPQRAMKAGRGAGPSNSSLSQKAKLAKKMESGQFDQFDLANAFDMLED